MTPGVWGEYEKIFVNGKVDQVKCLQCSLVLKPHSNRMRDHIAKAHSAAPVETEKKRRLSQPTIPQMLDRPMQKEEQERALTALAAAAVSNGWSHNSLCSPSAKEFFHLLRGVLS